MHRDPLPLPPVPAEIRVVILNGAGSVGKTSIGRALQRIAAAPFLLVQMDAFIDMLPAALIGHPDGLMFEARTETDGAASLAVRSGAEMARLMRGMRHAVVALAAQGNRMIIDEVMLDPATAADYRSLLAGFEMRLVGIHAPLAVIEARERARGDRAIGLARWQAPRVHAGMSYDLEIDAGRASAEGCAGLIRDALAL
jgi:chloramphenicol 3-O phosphotransferase